MNFPKTLLAASIAVLFLASHAMAAGPMMSSPAAQASPQQASALLARLAATRAANGLDQHHGFTIMAQHPGVTGTKITRAAHTFKGVRVFQSESVLVTDAAGRIISESVSDRRSGLGNGASNTLLAARTANFAVTPTITASAAVERVVRSVSPSGSHHAAPSAELIIGIPPSG